MADEWRVGDGLNDAAAPHVCLRSKMEAESFFGPIF